MNVIGSGQNPNLLNIIPVELADYDNQMKGTFTIKSELNDESVKQYGSDVNSVKDDSDVAILTPEEKIKKMRGKNLYTLDKQTYLLENQTNMINAYDFVHSNNISNIGREFALQSANLALSRYLQEKDNMQKMQNSVKDTVGSGQNVPSVNGLRS
jgi:hypothetical protein